MKKLILLLFLLSPLFALADSVVFMIVDTLNDDKGNFQGYRVTSYTHSKDGAPTVTDYKTVDELAKVNAFLGKAIYGTSKTPGRLRVYFNDDGTIQKVEAQEIGAFKSVVVDSQVLDKNTASSISVVKSDFEGKS